MFLLLLTVLTSTGAYLVGRFALGYEIHVGRGVQRTLETVGLAVVFFMVNVSVTVVGILGFRALGWFISLYVATDYTLVALSSLQAVLFQFWRYSSGKGHSV
jgi:hypothetical protein